jgi:acyl-CoA dehydrogenase
LPLAPVAGSLVFAFGLTEPHSGSDVRSMRTRAVWDGADWIIDGAKTFVAGTPDADAYVASARSGQEPNHATAFIDAKGTPGLTARGDLDVAARHPIGSLESPRSLLGVDDTVR